MRQVRQRVPGGSGEPGLRPRPPPRRQARANLDETVCLGAGCACAAAAGGITLRGRPERVITPVDSVHRVVLMAIERGTLAELIFDRHYLASHRAMAAILGAILRLPPVKRAHGEPGAEIALAGEPLPEEASNGCSSGRPLIVN